jgi:flagellar export protein FliJ
MLETHRQRWIAKRQRLESLQRVLEKYEDQELTQEARRDQKLLDELPNTQASFGDED